MWGFCGAEHISYDRRWYEGYLKNNRPVGEGHLIQTDDFGNVN